jgi:uncharacterized protein DUF6364
VLHVNYVNPSNRKKQNLTITLERTTIQKAKLLAARRSMSISGLVAHQIEALVEEEEEYRRAAREAIALLEEGFHLGGKLRVTRDQLHDR